MATPDGATWKWDYDDKGQLIAFTNPVGGRWTCTRGGRGVVIEAARPSGQQLSSWVCFRLAFAGDQRSVRAPSAGVDLWGNVIADYDAKGLLRSYRYDVLGRLTKIIEVDGSETIEHLDACGLVSRIRIDGDGNSRRFLRNVYGDLLEQIDPLGYRVRWECDSEGRVRQRS